MAIGTPRHCGKCGYELSGLGRQGTCPECGSRFDLSTGVGIKSALDTQERFDRKLRRIRTYLLIAAAVMVMICAGVLEGYQQTGRAFWVGLLFCGIFLFAALASYVFEKGD